MIEKNASVTWKISENLSELQEEEIIFKNEVSVRDFWDNIIHNSMWIFVVPEGEEREGEKANTIWCFLHMESKKETKENKTETNSNTEKKMLFVSLEMDGCWSK